MHTKGVKGVTSVGSVIQRRIKLLSFNYYEENGPDYYFESQHVLRIFSDAGQSCYPLRNVCRRRIRLL